MTFLPCSVIFSPLLKFLTPPSHLQSYLLTMFSISLRQEEAIGSHSIGQQDQAASVTHTLPLVHCYINGFSSFLRPSLCALDFVYSHLLKTATPTILLSLPASFLVYFFFSIMHLFANHINPEFSHCLAPLWPPTILM